VSEERQEFELSQQLPIARRMNAKQPGPEPSPDLVLMSKSSFDSLRSLLKSVKSEAEKNAIALALERTGWNRKAAARLLKVSYRTVLYKIEQYRMAPSQTAADGGGGQD
jgi:DNA-binding NtrC family response regulator